MINLKSICLMLLLIISVACGSILLYELINNFDNNSPVEERKIDSLVTINDSIKLKVESLDSIKHAKVIEVIGLNNDSTVKLFYELVSE